MSCPQVVLITGANRGIGLEFVKQYLALKWTVIATCRSPNNATELQQLASNNSALHVVALEVTSDEDIAKAKAEIEAKYPDGINVLVNNAAVAYTEKILDIPRDRFRSILDINVVSTLSVSQAFIPLLRKGAQVHPIPSVIANITSRIGSIEVTTATYAASYRISKTALNMLSKLLALEFESLKDQILCLSVHPGWVDTDMGRGAGKPPLSPEKSVEGMLQVLESARLPDAKLNGSFIDFQGKIIPW